MPRIKALKVAQVDRDATLDEITEENVHLFLTATMYTLPLYGMVREEFEEALKAEAPIDKRKKKQETKVWSGDVDFDLTTTRSEKTAYQATLQAVRVYLDGQLEAYADGKRPVGILSIHDEPYISIGDVADKLERVQKEHSAFAFSTKIGYDESLADNEGRTLILRPGTYHNLTTRNATDYITVREQESAVKKLIVEPFKELVKEGTGYTRDNVPEETKIMLEHIGDTVISIVSAPRQDTKYKDVVSDFEHYIAECAQDAESGSRAEEVAVRNGVGYVRLKGLLEHYHEFMTNREGETVQHDVSVLPLPAYDHVLAGDE